MSIDEKIEYLDSQIWYIKVVINSNYLLNKTTELNNLISDRINLKKEREILIKQKIRIEKLNKININNK